MPILTAEERVGTLLAGRYRLESILGSGGTSVVYRASHAWTGRTVAVKLLKPEHARDRGLVMRFLREARSASTLVHPNVVAILDMGTDPAGDVYLAMELLTGESLGALLDREQVLSPARAVELLRPVMEAIASAHARGIVHRDVKPDNVLIGDRGDGVARSILLDFGMAKMTEAAWGHATQSGLIVGTPFYMSPEQAEGAADVGPASDVWSLGVVWYRCLSGTLPFFGSAPTSLLLAIVRGDHVPLRERAPEVPEALASVIERALRVDRGARYADVAQMLEALDRAVREGVVDPAGAAIDRARGAPAANGPAVPLPAPREPSAPSRGRVLAAIAIAAAMLIAIAIGSAVIGGGSAEPAAIASVPAPPPAAPGPSAAAEPAAIAASAPPAGSTAIESPARTPAVEEPAVGERSSPARPRAPVLAPAGEIAGPPAEITGPPAERAPDAPRRRGLARGFGAGEHEEPQRASGLATEW